MRAIWTGALSFGLVNIPVKLYSASEDNAGLKFNYLHKKDNSPVRYAKICRSDGQEIPFTEIVKGYEYQKGDYVILTEADFKKADARKTKTVDIVEFTDEKEIDPILFEKPYYLEPDRGAAKPYALLREALNRSGKVGVAKFVLRNREHLAVLKPSGNAIVLEQIRYNTEVRNPTGLNLPDKVDAEDREIDMALKLIDQLSGPFIAEDFHDTYTEELEEIIDQKVKGQPIKPRGEAPENTQAKDLMAMLKASLEQEQAKSRK